MANDYLSCWILYAEQVGSEHARHDKQSCLGAGYKADINSDRAGCGLVGGYNTR